MAIIGRKLFEEVDKPTGFKIVSESPEEIETEAKVDWRNKWFQWFSGWKESRIGTLSTRSQRCYNIKLARYIYY